MRVKHFVFPIIIILFGACESGGLGDCFKPTGTITTEDRFVGRMNAVELHDRINLHVNFADDFSLKVKAGKNLLESIRTEMQGITLVIRNDNRCNWVRSFKNEIDVFLTVPELKSLHYFGTGEVSFLDTLVADTFRLEMWDATGILNLSIDTKHAELKSNSGPVDVFCDGKTNNYIAFNNGIGVLDAGRLKAKSALGINSNSGKIIINAKNRLDAKISGSGNIEYFGSPLITLTKTGDGNLIQLFE